MSKIGEIRVLPDGALVVIVDGKVTAIERLPDDLEARAADYMERMELPYVTLDLDGWETGREPSD